MDLYEEFDIITIDGPSGVGKGTLARWLSHKLGYRFLDSGSIYRLAALYITRKKIKSSDVLSIVDACRVMTIDFSFKESGTDSSLSVFLDGDNVTKEIRTERIGSLASNISSYSALRAIAPLVAADDAVIIDTTNKSKVDVQKAVIKYLNIPRI